MEEHIDRGQKPRFSSTPKAIDGIQNGIVLGGHVYVDELYKSSGKTDEKRKRGISRQQIPILVLVDDRGGLVLKRCHGLGKPNVSKVAKIIPHLGLDIQTVTTDCNDCHSFLDGRRYRHENVRADTGSEEYRRKMEPINNLCKELGRHNGIVADYLQHYLDFFYVEHRYMRAAWMRKRIARYLTKLAVSGKELRRKDY
ncbi:MAG TPA: transposase [Candidatus Enterosoma merdigallinarum]|nr:transposase [Candidatus Enterosoma merdigallinarum]